MGGRAGVGVRAGGLPVLASGSAVADAGLRAGPAGAGGAEERLAADRYAGHRGPAGFQHLLNGASWDADTLRDDVQQYVADQLGCPDGVLVVDDTGFLKKGTTSAGVQRQYSGTAGRTEICKIGVFAAYATAKGRALVDRELYLPKSWTGDTDRCRTAGIPESHGFATKGELARAMILRVLASSLPIAWVTGDCAYGQEWRMRRTLEEAGVGYVLAVPKSQQLHAPFARIDQATVQAPPDAWERMSCGDGAKGPRVDNWAAARPAGH